MRASVCFTSTRSSPADIVDVQEEGFGEPWKHDADFNLLCDADYTSCELVVSGRSLTADPDLVVTNP